MQINNNSDFVEYTLSEHEQLNGSILNYLQKGVIQNERMKLMEQLIQLKPDEMTQEAKESYWQREAYLRGQLDNLTHMLSVSQAAELAVNPDTSQE